MPARFKLFKTSTFRLATLYLAFFVVSVGTLLGYVYWNTTVLLQRQTDATIRAEVLAFSDQFELAGLAGVTETVQRRSRNDVGAVYLLTDARGQNIAGNLPGRPAMANDPDRWSSNSFVEFPVDALTDGSTGRLLVRAYHTNFGDGTELIAGRDVQEPKQFQEIIKKTLYGALAMAIVMGLGGGLLMSHDFLQRVDAITEASRTIMGGNMAERMPVAGTGDELDRLALALNEMLDQIERLMAGMKEVSSNVAHDLRTPLSRIKANVESALRSGVKDEYRAALEKTVEESDRLLHVFSALLSIARAESGHSRAGLEFVDAKIILSDVAELYEPIAEEQGGQLTVEIDGELNVRADRQLLAQAVSNLVDNALKYAGSAEITVAGKAAGGMVVISVGDHGQGIAPEDRTRVIERFVRLDSSRSLPGNGLGLSLVAGVMKLHGGSLILEDNHPGLLAKLVLPQLMQH